MIFKIEKKGSQHHSIEVTTSQLGESSSALYLHGGNFVPLGKVKTELWPFKPAIDYITNTKNSRKMEKVIKIWGKTRNAYTNKDRKNKMYYLANASGHPPQIAKIRDNWPNRESISDAKTSAGLDRTDDIKKGIYQVLKIGAEHLVNRNIRTALISNLPAYRHGQEYIQPFVNALWGSEKDLTEVSGKFFLEREKLKWFFDYIITLEDPLLRNL